MLDNICMVMENVSLPKFEEILKRLESNPEIKHDENVSVLNWYNMRIVYRHRNQTLELKNSIHKLYNWKFGVGKPDNSTDFTLKQFNEIVTFISQVFDSNIDKIYLQGRLEFGVNIESDRVKAYSILERYQSHQGNRINNFETIPPRKGKPKHRSCYLTDYYIKGYYKDYVKELKVKSERKVIRYEIVTTELRMLRKVTGLKQITLSDLTQPNIWLRFAEFILKTYDKIRKIPLENRSMTFEDLSTIYLYCNSLFYDDANKILSNSQLKQHRTAQKKVYEKWNNSDENLHNIIRNKILEKFDLIISN
jgi:hypothetical protein